MYAKLRQFKLYFSQNIKKPTQIIDPSQPAIRMSGVDVEDMTEQVKNAMNKHKKK